MGVADLLNRYQPGEQTTSGTRITFSGSTQSSVSQPGIRGHMGSTHPVRERRGRLYFCLSSCRLTILGAFHETQKNRAQWSQDQMQKWTFLLPLFLWLPQPSPWSPFPRVNSQVNQLHQILVSGSALRRNYIKHVCFAIDKDKWLKGGLQIPENFSSIPSLLAGVRPLWLCLCQRQRDERQGGCGGELHVPAPERPPACHHMGAPTAPADRGLWHGAEPD